MNYTEYPILAQDDIHDELIQQILDKELDYLYENDIDAWINTSVELGLHLDVA